MPSSPCAARNSAEAMRTSGSAATAGLPRDSIPQIRRAPTAHGHNFTLLWRTEMPKFCGLPTTAGVPPDFWAGPHPWRRTGPGNATDGRLKFDLTKFDQSYVNRLRARTQALGNAGMWAGIY